MSSKAVPPIRVGGCDLIKTCSDFPEQYDVYANRTKIGYLRLRHGVFEAEYPDCGGRVVYTSTPKGYGAFDDDERLSQLGEAIQSLLMAHAGNYATVSMISSGVFQVKKDGEIALFSGTGAIGRALCYGRQFYVGLLDPDDLSTKYRNELGIEW
jgi:hypothetical protein